MQAAGLQLLVQLVHFSSQFITQKFIQLLLLLTFFLWIQGVKENIFNRFVAAAQGSDNGDWGVIFILVHVPHYVVLHLPGGVLEYKKLLLKFLKLNEVVRKGGQFLLNFIDQVHIVLVQKAGVVQQVVDSNGRLVVVQQIYGELIVLKNNKVGVLLKTLFLKNLAFSFKNAIDVQILELLIGVVDAHLLKRVCLQNFKSEYVQYPYRV